MSHSPNTTERSHRVTSNSRVGSALRPQHKRVATVGRSVVAMLIVLIFLLPFAWLIGSSFKSQFSIFTDVSNFNLWTFVPRHPTLENFKILFRERAIGRALLNSLLVACGQVAGTLILCSTTAYGLTRIKFKGQGAIFFFLLGTFLVPGEVLVVPLYHVASYLGLNDNLFAVFLPWVASPFGLFFLRQAFEEIPRELDEAAMLDGANHWQIFSRVILPNVRAPLATLSIVTFLFSWNAFLWPLVILQSNNKQMIQVAIAQSVVPGELPNWGITFAGATVAIVPVLILYFILQRHVVEGMATSGLKG